MGRVVRGSRARVPGRSRTGKRGVHYPAYSGLEQRILLDPPRGLEGGGGQASLRASGPMAPSGGPAPRRSSRKRRYALFPFPGNVLSITRSLLLFTEPGPRELIAPVGVVAPTSAATALVGLEVDALGQSCTHPDATGLHPSSFGSRSAQAFHPWNPGVHPGRSWRRLLAELVHQRGLERVERGARLVWLELLRRSPISGPRWLRQGGEMHPCTPGPGCALIRMVTSASSGSSWPGSSSRLTDRGIATRSARRRRRTLSPTSALRTAASTWSRAAKRLPGATS